MSLSLNDLPSSSQVANKGHNKDQDINKIKDKDKKKDKGKKNKVQKPWEIGIKEPGNQSSSHQTTEPLTEVGDKSHKTAIDKPITDTPINEPSEIKETKSLSSNNRCSDILTRLTQVITPTNLTDKATQVKNWLESIETQPQLKIPIPKFFYYKKHK